MKKIIIHSGDTDNKGVDLTDVTIISCNDGYLVFFKDTITHYDSILPLSNFLCLFIETYLKNKDLL